MKGLRQEFGLSVSEWAAWFGVDPRTVRRWEDGTRQPTGTFWVLLEAYQDGWRRNTALKALEDTE